MTVNGVSTRLRRVIPCLQLNGRRLVKTLRFAEARYLGDPINAVRIFNEKEVDELTLIDIGASKESRGPDYGYLKEIAEEAFMPLSYGGGISSVEQAAGVLKIGFEKIIVCSAAVSHPEIVTELSQAFGSQSVIVSIDVKKDWLGRTRVCTHGGRKVHSLDPLPFVLRLVSKGAGEVIVQFIERDGTGTGFDCQMLKRITQSVRVPVVGCGGIGSYSDIKRAFLEGGASGVAAGSQFVFQGKHKAVLIQYLTPAQLDELQEL